MESNNLKKPPLAAFLSAISPGIGVFYAENKVRTFLFFAYLCLALLILVTFFIPVFPTLFVLMVLFSPFFYGYYLFDAVKIANIYRSMNVFSISKMKKGYGSIITLWLVFPLFFPVIISAFFVRPYYVPAGSMKPTLQIGDRMLVSRLIYKVRALKRGDVAVFIPPHDRDKIFVKRIVALEGDTIETKGNTLYVNGKVIDDSRYTQHTPNAPLYNRDFPPFAAPRYIPRGRAFADYSLPPHQFRMKFPAGKPFVVPKGHVFAMGDNRDGSIDSRVWGPVSVDDIKGQAIAIYWSSRDEDTARSRGIRAQLEDVRFNRIGRAIRSAFDG